MKKSKLYFLVLYFIRKIYYLCIRIIKIKYPDFKPKRGTGGTNSARYCYSICMRHIVHLFNNGMKQIPRSIAEFGPGDSLGIGLCMMLAGVDEYYAFDIVEHANKSTNLAIFNELINLFKEKSPIPDNNEFSNIKPLLDDYSFPSHIFNENILNEALSDKRINNIKQLLTESSLDTSGNIKIKYIVPWENYSGNYPNVDFVLSQAVLEHIDNLPQFYFVMAQILNSGCFTSHEIDFKSHGETYEWNGHWAISNKKWKKIRGARPYLINREPLSTHLEFLKRNKFIILEKECHSATQYGRPTIKRSKLSDRFLNMSDEDYDTSSCFILAKKE
ncbi:hypothetical protein [Treponema primitia]|uniref:hypothetical protein n=1 Tax=Treponema primitia TaxID=88058 RepID=UPI0011D25790|nr:hypothetical protein [Treponema primitia]